MYICPNCNETFDRPMNFCGHCGAVMNSCENLSSEPIAATEPVITTTLALSSPASPLPTKAKVKSIVGMALGISGGISVAFALNFTVFAFYIVGFAAFIYGNLFNLICLPYSIAALILSNSAISDGSNWKMAKAGRILGIVGIIGCIVMTVIAILGLFLFDTSIVTLVSEL